MVGKNAFRADISWCILYLSTDAPDRFGRRAKALFRSDDYVSGELAAVAEAYHRFRDLIDYGAADFSRKSCMEFAIWPNCRKQPLALYDTRMGQGQRFASGDLRSLRVWSSPERNGFSPPKRVGN